MAQISKKRQTVLRNSEQIVRKIYEAACNRFGKEKVDNKGLHLIWDMRCIMGIQNQLPFNATEFKSAAELYWIATEVCGYCKQPTE